MSRQRKDQRDLRAHEPRSDHPDLLCSGAHRASSIIRIRNLVIPGLGEAESPESMNTGLWNMDSGLAARTRRTRACAY